MKGSFSEVLVLPNHLLPSPTQRAAIENHLADLGALLDQRPDHDGAAERATTVIVTKLLLALPGQKTSEAGAEAKGEAYLAALDDIASWAVHEAQRRWYRGDAGHVLEDTVRNGRVVGTEPPHNYNFAPSPAMLRRLACHEEWRLRARIADLKRVIEAVPYIDTTEHCRVMRGRIKELLPWMKMDGDIPELLPPT